MNWARIRTAEGNTVTGVIEGGHLHPRTALGSADGAGNPVALDTATLLPPVEPHKFIGLWNNFHASAEKAGNTIPDHPLFFLKPLSSLAGPGATVTIPPEAGRVIFEGELGIVIGAPVTRATEEEAAHAILGYTCVNDLTAIEVLTADPAFPQWTRAKGFDGFGVIGPVIATDLDWQALSVKVTVNGRERQSYPAADMILPPARIVSRLSHDMTLMPGDVIACGTSLGARPVKAGDAVEVVIEGIGALPVTMAAAG
ncbi:fumarylacetoacetate hydrolase family protein [Oceaniglobus roseus]|uniref:fumarylacetoacetate hydrolase family protein n=1 Tax=Oceaniglobus roseus TaxID=1737570 RepID=UPI000C7F67AF|nr:fumarylacetoacetate hydrolase family protein [Kandeliimicrobium roseum]